MNKTKSVVLTTLLTIVIVVLSLMCVVSGFSIPTGGSYQKYNSVISVINRGSDLGGGYSAVYYPEGVISASEYNAKIRQFQTEFLDAKEKNDTVKEMRVDAAFKDYVEDYVAWNGKEIISGYVPVEGASFKFEGDEYVLDHSGDYALDGALKTEDTASLFMKINTVCAYGNDKFEVMDDFDEKFDVAVDVMAARFDAKKFSFLSVYKVDGYTIRVNVPYTVDDYNTLFTQMGYTGDLTLRSSTSNRALLRAFGEHTLKDYYRSFEGRYSGSTGYVNVQFKTLGKDRVYDITKVLADDETDATLYFYVGETQVIGLGLKDGAVDRREINISGSFTPETADNVAIVLDSCVNKSVIELSLTASDVTEYTVGSGDPSMMGVYIVTLIVLVAMAAYSIKRYKGLGVVHLYAVLTFVITMTLIVALMAGMILNASGVAAIIITGILTALSSYYVFECIRKEFATGKMLDSAIYDGYKKAVAPLLDIHVLLLASAIVLYLISVSEMITFAWIFGLGVLVSFIVSWIMTRAYLLAMKGLVVRGKQYKFCGFTREVVEDDED